MKEHKAKEFFGAASKDYEGYFIKLVVIYV